MDEKSAALIQAKQLLESHRWCAMATIDQQGKPNASMIAYAIGSNGIYFHLSQLASHSRHLKLSDECSIVISECEQSDSDPQELARLSLSGRIEWIDKISNEYQELSAIYQHRLPDSAPLFEFSDFQLLRFTPIKARYVGGFGKAYSYSGDELFPSS